MKTNDDLLQRSLVCGPNSIVRLHFITNQFTGPAKHLVWYFFELFKLNRHTLCRYIFQRSCTCAAGIILKLVSWLPETSVDPQTESCLRDHAGFPSSGLSSKVSHTCAWLACFERAEKGKEPPERRIWVEWEWIMERLCRRRKWGMWM